MRCFNWRIWNTRFTWKLFEKSTKIIFIIIVGTKLLLQLFVGTNLLDIPIPIDTNISMRELSLTNINRHQSTGDINPDR
jgi:hypothetical protein